MKLCFIFLFLSLIPRIVFCACKDDVIDVVPRLSNELEVPYVVKLTQPEKDELLRLRELIMQDKQIPDYPTQVIKKEFVIDGQSFRVIERLGTGLHGSVYRCVNPQGQEFAIKDHFPWHTDETHQKLFEAHRRMIPTIFLENQPTSGDARKYKYIHGVTVRHVIDSIKLLKHQRLSEPLREKILGGYLAWHRHYIRDSLITRGRTSNVVFEIETGKYYLFDAF